MDNCIFCKIAQGEEKSFKVYEDTYAFAFLDKHPINPGHILVIPKRHARDFYDLDDENYTGLMLAVKKISKKVNEIIEPHKVGLIVAGWDVPHAHIHIVPMHDYNDITSKSMLEGKRANPTEEELSGVAKKLKF
jgi:histidine triad (HIT) family protein